MRLRNVKNKKEILNSSNNLIVDPKLNKGSWDNVFGNNNPIEIEIGMGKGDFIIEKAKQNPNINYIGIEKYDSVLVRAIEKIKTLETPINNLKLVRLDALYIDDIFEKEISTIYLNFSDPWPKKRHSKRRLTSDIFLKKYDAVFKNDKIIYQKTDNVGLFEYSIISLSEYGYIIKEISLDLHNSEIENNCLTEYEKKYSSKNCKINYLKAVK